MFNSLNLKSTYSTYENDIATEFYTPVLSDCVSYDRATAYFSAKALASYAQGLEIFAKNGYKYRLIISTEISERDYDEICQGYVMRNELKSKLLKKLDEELSIEETFNLSNLAHLIALGTIDIKMAFTKQGIFHDKFGIMKDNYNNIICFRGSNNETAAAFKVNYEAFDITCSWQASEFDYSKITKSIDVFENLWNNKTQDIFVTEIHNVIRDKILSYDKGEVLFEPVYLNENCLILDYLDNLELVIRIDINLIINSPMFKMRLKRYVSHIDKVNSNLIFKEKLTYPYFKKIISILEKESKVKKYDFFITERLSKYIAAKELHIRERANVGLAIKQQHTDVMDKYLEYKNIVDYEFYRKLREKQMWDSFFMCTMKKSSNFSVPGSGKTSSVLGVFAYLTKKDRVNKIVMIGPKNSFNSWIDEFNACFNNKRKLELFNIQDFSSLDEKKKAIMFETGKQNLLLFNYESLHSVLNEVCSIIDYKTLLVFDEVHKVKAIDGKRAEDALAISKNAYFTITMTGTPIPNSYADIRNILNILYHDEYNDFFGFSDAQLKNPSEQDMEVINDKLQPFFCRTTKEQLSVPSANQDILLETSATKIENEIFKVLCMKYAKNKLALIIRILQLESNPNLLLEAIDSGDEDFSDILFTDGDIDDIDYKNYTDNVILWIKSIDKTSKFKKCVSQTLDLVTNNNPVIVWCIFVDSILSLQQELKKSGVRVECIFGKTENEERLNIINRFKNGEVDVLITNPHTLAESVSLHSVCHNAIYFEYSYNLVHLIQSKDRIHRLGLKQDQYTQYYYLHNYYATADGTSYSLDCKIYERLIEKETVMLSAIENNKLEPVSLYENDIDIVFDNLKL